MIINANQTRQLTPKTVSDSLLTIREKWDLYPELSSFHHFTFGRWIRERGTKNLLLMGINPGESPDDWRNFPEGRYEESSELDPLSLHTTTSRRQWGEQVDFYVPMKHGILISELFFWSSKDMHQLRERIPDWKTHPLIGFCRICNERLIEAYEIERVVFTGISLRTLVSKVYQLTQTELIFDNSNRERLLGARYKGRGREWLFVRHWTGSRPRLLAHEKRDIQSLIYKFLDYDTNGPR
jgi:hypothetical protein